ncbi:MAG: MAPEG family protein [Devosiaceae bacterium]|nr:MAPEG family protein [Devosiaceae bacterium MH13]
MTPELLVLLLAVILAVIQLAFYAVPANMELESGYAAGPRDRPPATQLSDRTRRAKRAYENHLETLPWFAIVVIVAHLTGQTSAVTAIAARVYLGARIAYVPLYLFGVFGLRSLAWLIATLAILTILVGTLI